MKKGTVRWSVWPWLAFAIVGSVVSEILFDATMFPDRVLSEHLEPVIVTLVSAPLVFLVLYGMGLGFHRLTHPKGKGDEEHH